MTALTLYERSFRLGVRPPVTGHRASDELASQGLWAGPSLKRALLEFLVPDLEIPSVSVAYADTGNLVLAAIGDASGYECSSAAAEDMSWRWTVVADINRCLYNAGSRAALAKWIGVSPSVIWPHLTNLPNDEPEQLRRSTLPSRPAPSIAEIPAPWLAWKQATAALLRSWWSRLA